MLQLHHNSPFKWDAPASPWWGEVNEMVHIAMKNTRPIVMHKTQGTAHAVCVNALPAVKPFSNGGPLCLLRSIASTVHASTMPRQLHCKA